MQEGKILYLIFVNSYTIVNFVFQKKQSRKLQRVKRSGQRTVEGKDKCNKLKPNEKAFLESRQNKYLCSRL